MWTYLYFNFIDNAASKNVTNICHQNEPVQLFKKLFLSKSEISFSSCANLNVRQFLSESVSHVSLWWFRLNVLKGFRYGSDHCFKILKLLGFQIILSNEIDLSWYFALLRVNLNRSPPISIFWSTQILDFYKIRDLSTLRNGREIHQEGKSWILEIFVKFYDFFLIFCDFWQDFAILHFYQKWNLET